MRPVPVFLEVTLWVVYFIAMIGVTAWKTN